MKESIFSVVLVLLVSGVSVGQDSVFVQMAGDTVTIWDKNARENCASRFIFSVVWIDSNGAAINEIDTVGPKERCNCTYNLSLSFIGLGPGLYSADISRMYLQQYGYPKDSGIFIGETQFRVDTPQSKLFFQKGYQSDCLHTVDVEVQEQHPHRFGLSTNYPNPFNPTTTVSFVISHQSFVSLKVYDGLGRVVATLVNEVKQPGEYTVEWNAEGFASGVYFYRLNATGMDDPVKNFLEVKKMVLIR